MSDRFKFRVWNSLSKKWLHGLKSHQGCSLFGECMLLGGWLSEVSIEDHDNLIIEQCTGLKDKNGVLIYEGSLMQFEPGYNRNVFEVFWCEINLGWMRRRVSKGFKGSLCSVDTENMIVVGNIHENPELLK